MNCPYTQALGSEPAISSVLRAPLLPLEPATASGVSSAVPSLSSSEVHHCSFKYAGARIPISGVSSGSSFSETYVTQSVDWSAHCGGTSNAIPWLGFTTTFQPLTVAVSVSVS